MTREQEKKVAQVAFAAGQAAFQLASEQRNALLLVKAMMEKGTENITDDEWCRTLHAVNVALGEEEGEYESYPD